MLRALFDLLLPLGSIRSSYICSGLYSPPFTTQAIASRFSDQVLPPLLP